MELLQNQHIEGSAWRLVYSGNSLPLLKFDYVQKTTSQKLDEIQTQLPGNDRNHIEYSVSSSAHVLLYQFDIW